MPGTWEPRTLESVMGSFGRQLRAVQSQQQSVITNSKGLPIMCFGRIPGSDPSEYGIQLVDPVTTQPVALFGADSAGDINLTYYGASGQVLSRYDATGLHFYDTNGNEVVRLDDTGLHVYDDSGAEQVAAGLLNASPPIYGLGVLPYGETEMQMVGGFVQAQAPDVTGASNTAWQAFGSPSSVEVEVGPSGRAVVSVQAQIATNAANQNGAVGVQVDGGPWFEFLNTSVDVTGGISVTTGVQYVWTGISAGVHTFQLGYETGNNGTATVSFYAPILTVSPL